jgi:hypothetical protein
MTSHDLHESSGEMIVPWDEAREDRVLAGALAARARRAGRQRIGGTAVSGAFLFILWRAWAGAGIDFIDRRSGGAAAARIVEKAAAAGAKPSDTMDAGRHGTTGGFAGTGGLSNDRAKGSTGLGGSAGTS